MVECVGSRLASVQVRGRNPLRVAVRVFAGGPAAGFEQSVLWAAGEGQVVDVGGVALGVVGDVMDLAVIAGYIAAGC